MIIRLLLGFGLSAAIGALGFWRHSLTRSGWLGAIVVGTITTGLGSWAWGILIIAFFGFSSALSKIGAGRKMALTADKWSKSDQRDFGQTLANGGVPALLAVGYALAPHPAWWAATLGAVGTAAADTWATEIGTLSRVAPRMITSGRRVERGTSGGVSALGLGATLAGAATIGAVGWLAVAAGLGNGVTAGGWMLAAAIVGGVGGSLADSLLGATVQQMRWCTVCERETERIVHRCGTATAAWRGWRWLDNDWVNAISIASGAALAVGVWRIFA